MPCPVLAETMIKARLDCCQLAGKQIDSQFFSDHKGWFSHIAAFPPQRLYCFAGLQGHTQWKYVNTIGSNRSVDVYCPGQRMFPHFTVL